MKCGRSYPDGSPQILKGCEGCKGTRFFYTQAPIGERERQELAERTQDEIASGGDEPGRERRIPTKGELPMGEDRDWVSMGPGNLRTIVEDVVRRAHEKKPTFRVAHTPQEEGAPPSLEDWVRRRQEELTDDEASPGEGEGPTMEPGARGKRSDWPPWPEPARGKRDPGTPAKRKPASSDVLGDEAPSVREPEDVVYRRSRRSARRGSGGTESVEPTLPLEPAAPRGPEAQTEDEGLPSGLRPLRDEPFEGDDAPEEEPSESHDGRPETVEVVEQGVYDLDVRRLLDKNPIVVHKDGSYSLHLPSLMESLGKKRR